MIFYFIFKIDLYFLPKCSCLCFHYRDEEWNVNSSDGDEDSDTAETRSRSVWIEPLITKVETIEENNSNFKISKDGFRNLFLSPKENYFNLDEDDKINMRDDPELPKKRLTFFHNWSPGGHFIYYSDPEKILQINMLGIDFDILTALFEFIDKNTTIVIYNIELNNYINYGSRGNINILIEVMKNHIQLFKNLSNPLELNASYVDHVGRNGRKSNKCKEFFEEIIEKFGIKYKLINYKIEDLRKPKSQRSARSKSCFQVSLNELIIIMIIWA